MFSHFRSNYIIQHASLTDARAPPGPLPCSNYAPSSSNYFFSGADQERVRYFQVNHENIKHPHKNYLTVILYVASGENGSHSEILTTPCIHCHIEHITNALDCYVVTPGTIF